MERALKTGHMIRDIKSSSFLDNTALNTRMQNTNIDVLSLDHLQNQIATSD